MPLSQAPRLRIVVLGLSITSSWGNGHATTYRSLLRALAAQGHDVLFLERDLPWYADNRDLPNPSYARVGLYAEPSQLKDRYAGEIRQADVVIVGSYVPDGVEVGEWVLAQAQGVSAFYDIDTPVTLAELAAGRELYVSRALIPRYALYLSFTGGQVLDRIQREFGARRARALYCSVDPEHYAPEPSVAVWQLGYMGTYSADRQPGLEQLLLSPARTRPELKFAVVGPQYPETIDWPGNVTRIGHLAPQQHRAFYNRQRFTLNLTRAQMRAVGYSPSVRLFEAAACGATIISDPWDGLDQFFTPERDLLIAERGEDTLHWLRELSETERRAIGQRARARVLSAHTAEHRARELLAFVAES
jgi:spore maturation protein CgeB